jgi:nucleoside-diphosphate-sugar epimerase
MSPTILIVGATGNTGEGVTETLSKELSSTAFAQHRVIALTRSIKSSAAQKLSKLDHIEMVEKDWTMIDADWLKEREVERIFIASHNGVSHFTDESLFLTYALEAGVKYVVRISTTRANIGPSTPVFYARNHWAVEAMLSTPEFAEMAWTSLQPNVFTAYTIPGCVAWAKSFKETGKQEPLKMMLDENAAVAVVEGSEVGIIAAKLLIQENTAPHNNKKYVVVGPEDITGRGLVELVEKHTGTKVENAVFRDRSWLDNSTDFPKNVVNSLALAGRTGWRGETSLKASPTSPEILELYTPKKSAYEALERALAGL